MEISAEVMAGAALLDRRYYPGHWWQEVEPTLSEDDMVSFENCVLGRLYGSYHEGTRAVFAGTQYYSGADFGFHGGPNIAAQWNELIRRIRVANGTKQ